MASSAAEAPAGRQLVYTLAITEGVRQALAEDPLTFLAGEDVAGAGSVFGIYRGLLDEFGAERVIDTPISESGIIGLAVGAGATGLRPIVDIMFMDFIGECMDEIANQLAKMRYMFGGKAKLPVTVLTMSGAGMNLAAQHSQSLEAWLCHLPGLKVVMPATPYDVKGAIITAVREDNPVFVVMCKGLMALPGEVPEEMYEVPIGKAKILREGDGLTIVAFGRMIHEAQKAADALQADGINAEVIRPAVAAAARHGHDRPVGAEDAPRDGRARSRALRRARRRDRGPDPGARVRQPRRARGPRRCAVLAGAVQPGARARIRARRRADRERGAPHPWPELGKEACPAPSASSSTPRRGRTSVASSQGRRSSTTRRSTRSCAARS